MIEDTETAVCRNIKDRQQLGLRKYQTTVAGNNLTGRQWLQHLYEELLDASIYCKRLMQEMDKRQDDFK
jgi:hypothetical protein